MDDAFDTTTKFSEEPATTSVRVTGLEDGKAYNFWVVAKNAGGSATRSAKDAAIKTSDDIPDYLKVNLVPGGPAEHYVATNLAWPGGDYYRIKDLGEAYPMDERYKFSYGGPFDTGGTIKYVRKFANPPAEPAVGRGYPSGLAENLDWDINRGVIIYATDRNKFMAIYYLDEHIEPKAHPADTCHAPEAVMGTANGGSRGFTVVNGSLLDAIDTFAKIGGPGESGGRYANFTMMRIYYAYQSQELFSSLHQ